jgi:hypothetical protein
VIVMATYQDLVDGFRCHETSWLRSRDDELEREQRRLKVEQLAVRRVLDERDALSPMPDASVSARTTKSMTEVARSLESLPALAECAASGELSWEQLEPLTRIATPETDKEWARRGRNCTPLDLQKRARQARKVTAADAQRRYEARSLRIWREAELGMIAGRFRLPDLDGILVEKVLDHMAEQLRPAKGEAWDSLEHRYADGFVELCRTYADVEPTGKFKFTIVTHRREDGTADCDGLDLAPETVDAITPDAMLKTRVDDPNGFPIDTTRAKPALPKDVERFVIERDPHCRVPGCNHTRRLQIHHLVPCCQGGHDGIDNLARVCPYHHRMLIPHGKWVLTGDPNQIDGLRLVHQDDLIDARAGPAP